MILINPKSTKFGIFERYVPLSVPIGIGYLAGSLISHNKDARVIDEHIAPISKEILERSLVDLKKPHVFGISSLTACINRSYEISGLIKSIYPESKVVLGGIHPTVLPDEVLKNKDIDFVIRREGEEVVNELYSAITNRGNYQSIKGISFKKDGSIVHNEDAMLPDLDKIPPFPYRLFEDHIERYNFGFIMSSRGCPYDCIFCSQRSISGRNYRYVPTEVVITQIETLIKKYNQTHINFVDDNFTVNKERIKELTSQMIKRGLKKHASFDCQTRADVVDDEVLKLLKAAGFRLINFGLESASDNLMDLLNKKETVKQNIDGIRLARKHGFSVSGTFIFGLPTETKEDRNASYRLAKQIPLDYVRFNNATPYPGTKLYEIAKSENRLYIDKNWTNLNACASLTDDAIAKQRLPYVPTNCSEAQLKKEIIKANLSFSLNPIRVIKLLVKRVGPAGWFYLPPRWYLSPVEWFHIFGLGCKLIIKAMNVYLTNHNGEPSYES